MFLVLWLKSRFKYPIKGALILKRYKNKICQLSGSLHFCIFLLKLLTTLLNNTTNNANIVKQKPHELCIYELGRQRSSK